MRILVFDDDPAQLETICRGLFLCGHEVCSARSVADAGTLLAVRGADAFDLLLTDVSGPEDVGATLVEVARTVAPALPALVITGSTDGPELAAVYALGRAVLTKPFTPDELEAAIRAAGGEARQSARGDRPPRRPAG